MRRVRTVLACIAVLSLVPAAVSTPQLARAGGNSGVALTDFTQVTPANVIFYATVQSTSAQQATSLQALSKIIASKIDSKALLQQALGTAGGSSADVQALIKPILTALSSIFDGEAAIAALPLTVSKDAHGAPTVQLHLLLDAGLRPGINLAQLEAPLALVAPGATSVAPQYRNLPVIELDLRAQLAGAGQGSTSLPAASAISGIFYATVAGNEAVVASDLPSLKAAIDTWFGVAPSIAGVSDFQQTLGALPADRFVTSYIHVDTEQLRPLLQAAGTAGTAMGLPQLPKAPGAMSQAYSVSAEPGGLLFSASPFVAIGSLMPATSPGATALGEPAFMPANVLAFAALHDPGTLIRQVFITAYALLGSSCITAQLTNVQAGTTVSSTTTCPAPKTGNAIAQLDKALGFNLDDDLFSWMHGDASLALLPIGSQDFGAKSPTTSLSLVATVRVADQSLVQAKLDKIVAALKAIPHSGLPPFTFVLVPTSAGNPLHLLSLTPTGAGYTFWHGYLIVASALPADFAAMQQAGTGKNLASSPLYTMAQAHFGAHAYNAVLYVNLTSLRLAIEKVAAASGTDMRAYNREARPVLSVFKSLSAVSYAGSTGGGAMFVGISK